MNPEQVLRILVVEDVPADFLLLERHLRRHGMLVECQRVATNGELQAVIGKNWDVVLSDYSVPGMSFPAILQSIKETSPGLPVILVSGSIGEEAAVELLHLGVTDFILKDNLARLPDAIRRACDEAAERTARRAAENALRESEERLQLLIQHAPVALAMFDTEMRYLAVSRRWLEDYGLEGRNIFDASHYDLFPGMPAHWREIHRRGLAGEVIRSDEERFERGNGGTQWLSCMVRPWHAADGTVGGIVVFTEDITERKRSEAKQQAAMRMLQTVVDSVPHYIFWKDRQSQYLGSNLAMAHLAGVNAPEEMIGRTDHDFGWRKLAMLYREDDAEVMTSGIAKYNIVEPLDTETAPRRWLETSKVPLRNEDGQIFGVLGVSRDITERLKTEEKMRQAAKVFESTAEGVIITDPEANIVAVNRAFCAISGYSESEALGRTPRLLRSERHDQGFYRAMWTSIRETGTWQGEIWNRRKSGEVFPVWETISAVKDESGKVINYVSVFSDIGPIKQYEERLEFLANRDPLTCLPNRLLMNDRLERSIQRARREGKRLAVLFIDLDDFKKVNDGYGHPVGDQLLQEVGRRLETSIRAEDTAARLGGDEFVVVVEEVADASQVSTVAEKILRALSHPFCLGGRTVFIGASIGIGIYPGDGEDGIALLTNADAAMYRAKDGGRNTFCFYSAELTQAARDHLNLEVALRQAIEQQQFVLHFQPQIDIASGRIIGVEALVRWQHPQSGLVPPDRFIPFAEQTGLIVPIGDWVLHTACAQAMQWVEAGLPPIRVAVNISPRQFLNRDVVTQVRAVLDATRLPPDLLELEITEGAIMEKGSSAISALASLNALGVRLAIDDFGTGYSSLAYLRRFPIDVLKIDKSFMGDIPQDSSSMEIAVTIIAMAHNLHMHVVAEGVETAEQLSFLKAHGCDISQGYFHGRPVAAPELEAALRAEAARNAEMS